MKTRLTDNRFSLMIHTTDDAQGSDRQFDCVDTGGAKNGTLVLIADFAAASDISNLEVWTSTRSDFGTEGTQLTAIASDGLRQVALTSDTDNFYAKGASDAALSDVAINSNVVSDLTQDGMYVFALKDLSKYVNVMYDSAGAGTRLAAIFIGHDLDESPWAGRRTQYT